MYVCIYGFPCGSHYKEFACSTGDPGLIPGLGRSPEKGMAIHFIILAGEFHGQRSLVGYSPWVHKVNALECLNFLRCKKFLYILKKNLFLYQGQHSDVRNKIFPRSSLVHRVQDMASCHLCECGKKYNIGAVGRNWDESDRGIDTITGTFPKGAELLPMKLLSREEGCKMTEVSTEMLKSTRKIGRRPSYSTIPFCIVQRSETD